jgi:hypothetical protein
MPVPESRHTATSRPSETRNIEYMKFNRLITIGILFDEDLVHGV